MDEAHVGLLGETPPPVPPPHAPLSPPPSVFGRDSETAELRAILDAGGAAVLIGEAGIGKSTLLGAATAGRHTALGGAFGMLRFVPYLPLIQAVGSLPDRPASVALEVVRRVGPAGVLVIDDLHWADDATLGVLDRIVGRVPFLTAIRSGDQGTERALAAMRGLGATELTVAPLGDADGADLARRWQPSLGPAAARQLVARTGGNPLLIEQLARAGVTTTLKLAIQHRLRSVRGAQRSVLELLAVADAPLEVEGEQNAVDRLIRDGLVVRTGHGLAIRHALIGEVIVEDLPDAARRRLHREVAALAPDAASRARHLAAGGQRRAAFTVASEAATSSLPGLRAALLGLAAECASGAEAAPRRVEAAEALIAAGLVADAERVLGHVAGGDRQLAARREGVRAQVRWGMGDGDGSLASAEAAVNLATPGTELEARLLVERAWLVTLRREGARAVELAREALAAVRAAGLRDGPAQRVLGIAVSIVGGDFDEYLGLYEAAAADARAAGDISEELSCGKLIVATHESGDQALGLRLGDEFVQRAVETGMVAWAQAIKSSLVSLASSHGEPERAVVDGEALLSEPLERRIRAQTAGYTALALVDLGRFDDARRTIDAGLATAPDDVDGRFDLLWADAELALASGDAARALALADGTVERFGDADYGDTSFLRALRDWACADLGRDPGPLVQHPRPLHRQHLGTDVERGAIRLLVNEKTAAAAAAQFAAAAELYRPYHRRSEIRSRWAQGEALRREGRVEEARTVLQAAEMTATELGNVPIGARIRRSLRLAGMRRSAPRGPLGGLSAREREVLAFVAIGRTNAEIAARLGISRPTVARIVSNASVKLGASSRVQAAIAALEV